MSVGVADLSAALADRYRIEQELGRGVAKRVLTGPYINFADRSHDVGPDGRHLLLLGPKEETTTRLEVITGWLDKVRRAAPASRP